MQTLEDVMTPEEFAQARELAQKMVKSMGGTYSNAQLMLACAMVVAGFIYKDVPDQATLDAAADFVGGLLKTSVHALRKADEPQAQKPYMVPVPNTVN